MHALGPGGGGRREEEEIVSNVKGRQGAENDMI